ncbi:MAG: FHA domain-containing protein [Myxococcota bacterium]
MGVTHITGAFISPTAPTRIRGIETEPRIDWQELPALYRAARDHALATQWTHGPGYRLYLRRVGSSELIHQDLPASRRSYLVVGRHHRADLVLDRDPEVSLRHLLFRAFAPTGEPLSLRVVDLRARLPFFVDDDRPLRSAAVSGPIGLRFGRYALVAVPADGSAFALPDTLPKTRISDEPPRDWGHTEVTDITRVGPVTSVTELSPRGSKPASAVLTVRRGDLEVSVPLSSDELRRGVLVGRARRCFDGGIREVLHAEISRAHVLVLREGGRIRVFDLASTNGLFQDGRSIRTRSVPRGGLEVTLAKRRGVTLRLERQFH